MKNFEQSKCMLIIIIFGMISSCQKNMDIVKKIPTPNEVDKIAINDFNFHHCLITHTENDLYGDAINFFYNKMGNLDSVSFNGVGISLLYDKERRLLSTHYSNGVYFDFKYKSKNLFPVAFNVYFPPDGLFVIDSFRYNLFGRIISRRVTNVPNPSYSYAENYTYDYHGNIRNVEIKGINGGTVFEPGFTEYKVSKYDAKLNFIAGNPWIKFILFHSDLDQSPFLWDALSTNNAIDHLWIYDQQGDSYTGTSTFKYDNKGFANTISLHYFDNISGADLGIFTESSLSTCDDASPSLLTLPSGKSSVLSNKIRKLNTGIPPLMGSIR